MRASVPQVDLVRSDADAADLQRLLDSTPSGGLVIVTRHWTVDEPVVVRAPAIVRFAGGSITSTNDIDILRVESCHVTIENARLRGPGADRTGLGRGIRATGTVANPIGSLAVVGAEIRDVSHDGILLEHCSGFSISDCTIERVGYAGVLMFSCADGEVVRSTVATVVQPAGYVNSYGIQAVRTTTTGLESAPRSTRIVIADNTVTGVLHWEGIDTHGGQSIVIARNTVTDCRVGIAAVPSKDEADASRTKYAPLDVHVIGNRIHRESAGPGSGIVVRGAGESLGSTAERATGIVYGNVIEGFGDGERDGAVLAYFTQGLVITENRCEGAVGRGLSLYHSNDDVIVHRNTISLVAAATGAVSVAVDVRSVDNTGHVVANRCVPGETSVGRVYGLLCRQTPNELLSTANDWSGTTTAVVAGPGVSRFRDG